MTVWVEDYRPDGLPVHSRPTCCTFSPDEHAIWITSQMSKWHQASLDVRDVECNCMRPIGDCAIERQLNC